MYFQPRHLTQEALAQSPALTLLVFGVDHCPHCHAGLAASKLQPKLAALNTIAIEDGAGRRLGRSFKVKLWPTYILLERGQELARVVRPRQAEDFAPITDLLGQA